MGGPQPHGTPCMYLSRILGEDRPIPFRRTECMAGEQAQVDMACHMTEPTLGTTVRK